VECISHPFIKFPVNEGPICQSVHSNQLNRSYSKEMTGKKKTNRMVSVAASEYMLMQANGKYLSQEKGSRQKFLYSVTLSTYQRS
jgi:hypothetical protein